MTLYAALTAFDCPAPPVAANSVSILQFCKFSNFALSFCRRRLSSLFDARVRSWHSSTLVLCVDGSLPASCPVSGLHPAPFWVFRPFWPVSGQMCHFWQDRSQATAATRGDALHRSPRRCWGTPSAPGCFRGEFWVDFGHFSLFERISSL